MADSDTASSIINPDAQVADAVDANASTLYANVTSQYDYINAMLAPDLCPTPTSYKDMSIDCMTTDPLANFDRYAVAYPITGVPIDDKDAAKSGSVDAKGFYSGPDFALGSNYFENLGKCGPDSVPECVGKDRAVYIRNITTGSIPLFGNVSLAEMTGTSQGVLASKGIIPSALDVGVSAFGPQNIAKNVFESKGNFGGSKCRRVKLPVGAHIYDPKMKITLDYDAINRCVGGVPPDLATRQYRTRLQINRGLKGIDATGGNTGKPKTWWYEEQCTPSYNWTIQPPGLVGDENNGESTYLPSAEPLLEIEPTYTLSSLPALTPEGCALEPFVGHSDPSRTRRDHVPVYRGLSQRKRGPLRRWRWLRPGGAAILLVLLCIALVLVLFCKPIGG